MRVQSRFCGFAAVLVSTILLACGGAKKEPNAPTGPAATPTEVAAGYMSQAGMAVADGNYETALTDYDAALAEYDKERAPSLDHAEAHSQAADAAHRLERYDEALKHYDAAVKIYLRYTGNSQIKAALALANMAVLYKMRQNREEARQLWMRAIEILRSQPENRTNRAHIDTIEQNIIDLDLGV